MERFFDWLYATHRNYLLGTGIAYFIPMYILGLLLAINDGWIIKIMLFFYGRDWFCYVFFWDVVFYG
jgi:hypothetical protein